MSFIGIDNSTEYYSNHYLAAILEKDLQEVIFKTEDKDPVRDFRNLWQDYFAAQAKRKKQEESAKQDLDLHFGQAHRILGALGYTMHLDTKDVEKCIIPILCEAKDSNGAPRVWWIQAINAENEDPLSTTFIQEQYPETKEPEVIPPETIEDIISNIVFNMEVSPRFVLLLGATNITLLDKNKWREKRMLRFDLDEILSRRDTTTLKGTLALLHKDQLAPEDNSCALDSFDDSSHKHAYGVSEDLKYNIREAIELIGNEAVFCLKQQTGKEEPTVEDVMRLVQNRLKRKKYTPEMFSKDLSKECLRYMYRLLFLFYIESRPELGYAPMNSDVYRLGYSLEHLRSMELSSLDSKESQDGTYIYDSLDLLCYMIFGGVEPTRQEGALFEGLKNEFAFNLSPLEAHLFNPDRTKILNDIQLRNVTMQRVIELMSLSRPKEGKNQRRGRISYAQLGINQLGAVYEALLSYQGFFAKTELYEVKPKKERYDPLKMAYFVPEDQLELYSDAERVQINKRFVKHEKGAFIYRLAGRDREKSASYYTPESLTQCLVKYSLRELICDRKGKLNKTAEEILNITVCEPAMGSAAFLNEAVNQLAEAYLQQKQKELGKEIPHDDYLQELQKAKMYIADNNVYGVDLNPIAVELAEVSLWLNTIHKGGYVPWFGLQLFNGNSLIGARRQFYTQEELKTKKKVWQTQAPTRIEPGKERKKGQIFHFLVPCKEMAQYKDVLISGKKGRNPLKKKVTDEQYKAFETWLRGGKEGDYPIEGLTDKEKASLEKSITIGLAEEEYKEIEEWRNGYKEDGETYAGFMDTFTEDEIDQLLTLSAATERLWKSHTNKLMDARERTSAPMNIFGYEKKVAKRLNIKTKDQILDEEIHSQNVRASSPYRRLKMVMDYWCALWFWPLDKAHLLPDRNDFLRDMSILLGKFMVYDETEGVSAQLPLFAKTSELAIDDAKKEISELGLVNVDKMVEEIDRLKVVQEVANRMRFFHWELEFADIFATKGGFDLILGNPPWLKVEWKEAGVISDFDPLYSIKGTSASDIAKKRSGLFEQYADLKPAFLAEYVESSSTQGFLNAVQNYAILRGVQTNLYKCFLPQAWMIGSKKGTAGFLHPEGVYDDPKGGNLREQIYGRLRYHFQFINEHHLFPEVDHHTSFSVNIFNTSKNKAVRFHTIANLFIAKTINVCFDHRGYGPIPGIKDENHKWNVNGHKKRLVKVTKTELELFAKLYDKEGTPKTQARLPALHSTQLIEVLRRFASQPKRLGDIRGDYFALEMWHETGAQKDKTIRRDTLFPSNTGQWILSGPHFFVGTPFNKTPRAVCTLNSHYDNINLSNLPIDYLPRTNYVPDCSVEEYSQRTPRVPWGEKKCVTDLYRHVNREMIGPNAERTMIPVIISKGVGHINTCIEVCFKDKKHLISYVGSALSVVIDFFVKSTGMGHANLNVLNQLPILSDSSPYLSSLHLRTLLLNCLTTHYAELWVECFKDTYPTDTWAKTDPRLDNNHFTKLTKEWTWHTPVRTDFARRQLLVEIDVLVAMALGLTLEELQTIYRVQFPVMRMYESDTWYDQKGRIIFTNSKGLVGVGLPRRTKKGDPTPAWEDVKDMTEGTVSQTITDDTLPGGPVERTITYHAPFTRCNREEDYKVVWKAFEQRFPADDSEEDSSSEDSES